MTFVVGLATVVTEEGHGVVCCNVLWMCFDELFGAVPQSWNCLDIFVQTQNKAVLFLVILHVSEWVIVYVAVEFDAWFNSPVILKLLEQWMTEEEARLESAHVSVAD